jgi:hypothetical protein
MSAVSSSDWLAFLSLGLAVSAAGAIPVVAWVDADYLFVSDWQAVGDRLSVEIVRARLTAGDARRDAAVTVAAFLLLLSAPSVEVTR